jgi:hypothetical protein
MLFKSDGSHERPMNILISQTKNAFIMFDNSSQVLLIINIIKHYFRVHRACGYAHRVQIHNLYAICNLLGVDAQSLQKSPLLLNVPVSKLEVSACAQPKFLLRHVKYSCLDAWCFYTFHVFYPILYLGIKMKIFVSCWNRINLVFLIERNWSYETFNFKRYFFFYL